MNRFRARLVRVAGRPASALVRLLLRLSRLEAGIALVYHRVEHGSGPAEAYLAACHSTRLFRSQVRHAARNYRLVTAAELPDAARARRRGGRFPVAITFDDDLRSHVEGADAVLRGCGAPATFFLCAPADSRESGFWWEYLQEAFDAGADIEALARAAPAERPEGRFDRLHRVAKQIERSDSEQRAMLQERLRAVVPARPAWAGLDAQEVRRLVDGGHEVGFHTRRHDRLPALDADGLERALRDGRDDLAVVAGRRVRSFAYPHGAAGGREARAAEAAGYEVAFTAFGRAWRTVDDRFLIGRLEPSFISTGHLAAQLARALVLAAWSARQSASA